MIVRVLIVASLLFTSCHSILFNDAEAERNIPLSEFQAIKISGIYNVILVQDSANNLRINGKNDITSVSATVENDTLFITDSRKLSFNPEKNTLEIHFTTLEKLITTGPVNLSCNGNLKAGSFSYDALGEISEVRLSVECSSFQLVNSGNTLGNFYLSGSAENCYFFNRYGSRVFADSLRCSSAAVINESVGDVHINASDFLTAYISGPGNIYYYGQPLVEIVEDKGEGKLINGNSQPAGAILMPGDLIKDGGSDAGFLRSSLKNDVFEQ